MGRREGVHLPSKILSMHPNNGAASGNCVLDLNLLFCVQDVDHRSNRDLFDQCASWKHYITKQDISNIHVNVKDNVIIRHKNDPISVSLLVAELQQEAHDPVLLFKSQGERSTAYPNIPTGGFVLVIQTQFQQQMF